MIRQILTLSAMAAVQVVVSPLAAADPEVSPYAGAPGWQETKEERLEWFKDAKFGMFIHWGLYAPAGGYWPPSETKGKKYPQHYSEWIRNWANVSEPEYGQLTKPLFKPDRGCTDEWAKVAKDAGMKYTVLTTKHHDGYTLFNSKAPYSVKNDITGGTNISPKGRDMVAEYAESVRKQGLKVGYYYSLIDWQHPDALPHSRKWPIGSNPDHSKYVEYMYDHMVQLFSDYGESDMMWVDYSSAQHQGSTWGTKKLLTKLHELQPQALVNNRFWNGLENANGDFFTPEKYIPASGYPGRVFEVCHTMNESFGYSHHDTKWKSTKDVVEMLVDIVSKGGNLLLNVGPDARGHIPEESVRVLRETGKWLQVHGDAIYGTDATPFAKLSFDGRCTQKAVDGDKTDLFFHLFSWPSDKKMVLPALENEIVGAVMLGSGDKLKTNVTDEGLVIKLPARPDNDICPVVTLRIVGAPKVDELMSLPQQKSDRSVIVDAGRMTLHGPGGIKIAAESGNVPEHVSYWVGTDNSVDVTFNVNNPGKVQAGGQVTRQPGRYAVWLRYAADPGGAGELKVSTTNDQVFKKVLKPTGGWSRFENLKVGEITLTDVGETTIKLQVAKVGSKGFINLAAVKLVPLD